MATKKYGFLTLTFLVIANMVGAGVFATSGFTLADLGSPKLVILAWLAGGCIALAGAVGYGQLVRKMPESGGEYLFLSRAAHPLLGFIAGWVSLIAGFSGAIAFAATTLESYLVSGDSGPTWVPKDFIAVSVIVVAAIFHGLRPKVGAVIQNSVVVLKLGLLALFLLIAASKLFSHPWHGEVYAGASSDPWQLTYHFATSVVWISLSYLGFNAAVYVAEEAVDAHQTVPRSLVAGTSIVVVLYLLLNTVFVYAAPASSLAGVEDVAAVAATALGGVRFATFIRFTVVAALFTSVLSMMMAAPRVYAKMADDGLMPRFLRLRTDAPRCAIVLQVVVAATVVLVSDLRGLLSYLGLTLSLSAACSVACLFLPHVRTQPLLHRSHIMPAFYVVSTLVAASLMIYSTKRWQEVTATLVTFAAGAIVYSATRGCLVGFSTDHKGAS